MTPDELESAILNEDFRKKWIEKEIGGGGTNMLNYLSKPGKLFEESGSRSYLTYSCHDEISLELLRNISEDLYEILNICKRMRIFSIWRSVYFLILVSGETILSMISIINGICFSGISQNFIQVDNVRQLSDIS